MEECLRIEDLRRFSQSFNTDPKNILALNAVTKNGIAAVALSRKEVDRGNNTFSNLIQSPDVMNQERSGRCWLFSGLSTLALEAMKKMNLETFELSEIYQMFWDKLEKANYFLEDIIETKQEPLNGRLVSSLSARSIYLRSDLSTRLWTSHLHLFRPLNKHVKSRERKACSTCIQATFRDTNMKIHTALDAPACLSSGRISTY